MFAPTTEETFDNSNDIQKELLTLERDDLFRLLRLQYGACWGMLKFKGAFGDYPNKGSPFLYVDDNIDLHVLSQFMFSEWKLKSTNIVIPVLSDITNHKPFKNHKTTEILKSDIRNAANASEIWFTTNGLNTGLPQLIGTAFRDEKSLRRIDNVWAIRLGMTARRRRRLILIGIVCDDEIKDIINLKSVEDESPMDIKVPTRKPGVLSLNSDHTHFIIIRAQPIGSGSRNTFGRKHVTNYSDESQLERLTDSPESTTNRFRDRFEDFLYRRTLQQQTTFSARTTTDSLPVVSKKSTSWSEDGFPLICTFIRGTPETIALLYRKIEKEIPAVILKGTGAAADIIAFAYEEISAKNDKEDEDGYLKAELARRLLDEYPALKDNNVKRNEVRDHIISIVKNADQGKRKLLTCVDIDSLTVSSDGFRKLILSALLQSQKAMTETKANVQLKRNLLLLLDWNLPDLASSEILQSDNDRNYPIPTDLFDEAIFRQKREPFVDIFLDQEFVLHRYLKSDKLMSLFNQTSREFLITTSLEGILGLTEIEVPENFLDYGLNIIIKHLTGISHFFSKHEMDLNSMGIYLGDKNDKGVHRQRIIAEKKALRYLIIYAVLMNRHQLAMILWKRSSESIRMALICYIMFKNLAPYCYESYQRSLIKKQAEEFSDCAVEVLDKSFNEDTVRTFAMLDEKSPDWNNITTVEFAYLIENKKFLAHAACQKWITRQFYGQITPRNLSWGFFKCSDYLKIIMSVYLIFPMWFWIVFSPADQTPQTTKKGATESHEEKPISNIECIKILWNAPITKLCTSFVAYLLYLFFFTLAVMWPSCGNLILDCLVWFWTALIVCEDARAIYNKYRFQNSFRLKRALVEIIVQTIFLALYLGVRIIGLWWFGTCQILAAKAILGIGLIYYYCRIVYIFLPMSSRFGPLMIGLRRMIMGDFLTFLQLFAIFMISSSVAITAVLYPHHPLDSHLFSKAFLFRGLMALFSSEIDDLKTQNQSCSINAVGKTEREYSCLRLAHGHSFQYDNLGAYNHYGISSTHCNQTSWIAWFLLIPYFFLVKWFLASLLTAMFTLTGMRVRSQSEQFSIYYRFGIVMEYTKRPRLPPPFVVISYIDMLLSGISRRCVVKLKKYSDKRNSVRETRLPSSTNNTEGDVGGDLSSAIPLAEDVTSSAAPNNEDALPVSEEDRSFLGRLLSCKPCRKIIDRERHKKQTAMRNWEGSEANLYWKNKAKEYYTKTRETDKAQEKLDHIWNSMINGQKDTNVLQKSLRHINDRIFSLEQLMTKSRTSLEQSLSESQKFIHVRSRESPYIYTTEARFPVTEKSILWTVPYDLYDPTPITLSKDHICFEDDERPFVEPNLLKLSSTDDQSSLTSIDQADISGRIEPTSSYKWNQIVELDLSNGKKMLIDRETWISNPGEKTPAVYPLDTQLLIPLNPMGRTGVRGRGAFIRWGPNKSIMAIITRWKRHHDQFVVVDGQRILEALVFKDKITNGWSLPVGKVLGIQSPFGTLCRNFNKLTVQEDDSEHISSFQERDMIKYFESFARSSDNKERTTGFESHLVYRGYIDDSRNTDNAWLEAQIWNFHYGLNMSCSRLQNDDMVLWKDVTYNLHGFPTQASILREVARMHNAYIE